MKLHSPSFEKAVRRAVRSAVRASPELKRDYRAANRFRKQYPLRLLARPTISVVFGAFVWRMFELTGRPASALAVVALWALGATSIQAQALLTRLYKAPDLPALALLPLAQSTIFRWEWQRFLRGSLWLVLDLVSGYGALAWALQVPAAAWPAVAVVGVATWLVVVGLAALGVTHLPRLPYALVSSGFFILGFVIFVSRSYIGDALLALLDRCAPDLNLLLPTAWAGSAAQGLLPGEHAVHLVLLLPVAAIVWTLRDSQARLRRNYGPTERVAPLAPDLVPGTEPEAPSAGPLEADQPLRVGLTSIEDIVRSRQFLAEPAWPQYGWAERMLWRWLDAREQALLEFAFPAGVRLARPWFKTLRNLAVSGAAGLAVGTVSPVARVWILGAGLFVTVCQVLATVLSTGRAFRSVGIGGVNIPLYAGYPIGFCSLGHVLFKYSAVQVPFLIPFTVAVGLLLSYLVELPMVEGSVMGFKAAGLLLASRFIFLTFGFSSTTNDTSRVRLRSLALLTFVVVCSLSCAGLGAASLFLPNQAVAWLLWGLAALVAYLFFRLYGWLYNRNRFDLMSLPRR